MDIPRLPLDTCQRLKEAGAPQGTADYIWVVDPERYDEPRYATRCDACVLGGYCINSPELIDAYNSDELIALIQERYPNSDMKITTQGKCWHVSFQLNGWTSFEPAVSGFGDSLVEAVAELVIKLLEG